MKLLVTGGCGFIGSNFARLASERHDVTVFDKLTYAGSRKNIEGLDAEFIRGDITRKEDVKRVVKGCDTVVHFAAETHVDNSIKDPAIFITTNVVGTQVLLECARGNVKKFIHISTDEVYGSSEKGFFLESDRLNPRNPYSATKAAAEHLVTSYFITYGLPCIITRSSNNFGPRQNSEKFIPKMITNALAGKKLPVYGKGANIRDWLFVEDNCEAIMAALEKAKPGEIYNVGAGGEMTNLEVAKTILDITGKPESLISFVPDRPGHDFRYALNTEKIRKLGWKPRHTFREAIRKTVRWYMENKWFWASAA